MSNGTIETSLFIRACRGDRGPVAPVWFMRQAGRYLPEYRAVRAKHSMLDVIRTPELACEVTLQPIRRFGFDAAIIFADILNPLIGMGIELDFVEGKGPVIGNPIRSGDDIAKLRIPDPQENSGYTFEAIRQTAGALAPQGVPLIGFSGAPFTLAAYMIEGGSVDQLHRVKRLWYSDPGQWRRLQEKLVALVSDYLVGQAAAGAAALQLFDSWLGFAGPAQFDEFVAPYLTEIVRRVRAETSVPLIFFSTGTAGLFERYRALQFDVIGVDWRMSLADAAKRSGVPLPLQGNLDPLVLYAADEVIDREVARVLAAGSGLPGHIFNLGHGILPDAPIPAVERVIRAVRQGGG